MINKITEIRMSYRIIVLRLILAFLLIPVLIAGQLQIAVFFFLLTGLLSIIEDVVRKRFAYRSPKRIIADYIADKALIALATATLWYQGIVPWWFAIIILGKDVLTIVASIILIVRSTTVELKPVVTAKIAYLFQWVTIFLILLHVTDKFLLILTCFFTLVAAIEAFWKSQLHAIRKRRQLSQFSMLRMITIPDLITLGNGIAGLASIMFAINGSFGMAALLLLVAVLCDFMDGKVARWLNQQHEFGKELDSLADTISFGVAPAIFGYGLIQTKMAMVAFIIFVFCGVLRLARYNVLADKTKGFIGMPITVNGVLIPILFFASVPVAFYPYIYLILSFLMVSTIRVEKL